MPRRIRNRNTILHRLEAIRRFRNRVFHHEPIWKKPYLQRWHGQIIETIGWVDDEGHVTKRSVARLIGNTLFVRSLPGRNVVDDALFPVELTLEDDPVS